jgi:Leucine-rich repeat (LRR) protein
MADFFSFVVETTNESGIVEQKRVLANDTVLYLPGHSLVRIDGLERATMLQNLYVQPQSTHCLVSNLTHLRSFVQLNSNRFVDVPACVLALTRLEILNVSLVLVPFVSSLSLLTPLQLSGNCLSSVPAAISHMTALKELYVRTEPPRSLARCLTGAVF